MISFQFPLVHRTAPHTLLIVGTTITYRGRLIDSLGRQSTGRLLIFRYRTNYAVSPDDLYDLFFFQKHHIFKVVIFHFFKVIIFSSFSFFLFSDQSHAEVLPRESPTSISLSLRILSEPTSFSDLQKLLDQTMEGMVRI